MKMEKVIEEISSLERQLAEAEQSANAPVLYRLVSNDFEGVNAQGQRVGCDAFIGAFTSPDLLIEALHSSKVSIHVIDHTAIAIGHSEASGLVCGEPFHRHFNFTDCWTQRGSHWQLVSAHVSPTVLD